MFTRNAEAFQVGGLAHAPKAERVAARSVNRVVDEWLPTRGLPSRSKARVTQQVEFAGRRRYRPGGGGG
jgi:hypothetical protein